MALFNFGKKKEEEKKAPACACNCGCPTSEVSEITSDCCPEAKDGICCIKVWEQAANPVTNSTKMQEKL